MARSINQNAYTSALPNFRNLGVLLRVLVFVNIVAFAAALVRTSGLPALWSELIEISALVQPLLILSLLMLVAVNDWLHRLPQQLGPVAVILLELILTALLYTAGRALIDPEPARLARYCVLVFLVTAALLVYFRLRERALSPALSEARLQALQARIRPHFLFNSLNAVLSLIRESPRRAEEMLQDMAELFRVLMADNRELTSLEREVDLSRRYLDLEQLRLGDRLRVKWRTEAMPPDVLVPPLVLQPLIENAVYHGIEPRLEPGVIDISVYATRDHLHAVLRNPYGGTGDHHSGNRMAIANIRERLQLHFDAEASLMTTMADGIYEVHIVMPLIKGAPPDARPAPDDRRLGAAAEDQ